MAGIIYIRRAAYDFTALGELIDGYTRATAAASKRLLRRRERATKEVFAERVHRVGLWTAAVERA